MGDVALVGANGATDVTVAVAEEPRGRFGVPLAVISGLCLAASLPSLEIAPLAWIGLIPLLMAIRGRSLRAAFGLGWVTGTVFFLGTCYWIIHTIGHYTNVPVPLAAGVLLLMSSVLGCYHGAFALGLRWFEMRRLPAVWLAPALWVTLEWLRGWFFIGFPWAALGYSQYRFHSLVQMVEVTGVYGVSAVLVLFNVVVAAVLLAHGSGARRNLPALATLTLLVVLLVGAGRWRAAALDALPAAGTLRVGLAQGNVAQDQKWDPAFQAETMERYRQLTVEAARERPGLIVWPETAAPFFFQEPGPQRDEVLALARQTGTPLLFGSPAFHQLPSGRLEQLNRAYLVLGDGREAGTYDKMELVPFGEYVPFQSIFFFVSQHGHRGRQHRTGPRPHGLRASRGALRHAHLLRGRLSGADPTIRGRRRELPRERHQRRLVRPDVGSLSAPGAGRRSARSRTACPWSAPRTRASAPSSTPTGISAGRARCSRCCGTWTRSTGPGVRTLLHPLRRRLRVGLRAGDGRGDRLRAGAAHARVAVGLTGPGSSGSSRRARSSTRARARARAPLPA